MADEKSDTVPALLPIGARRGPTASFGMRISPAGINAGKVRARWSDITPSAATPTPYPSASIGSIVTPGASDLPADPSTLWEQTPTPSGRSMYMEGFGFNMPGQQAATAMATTMQVPQMQPAPMQLVQQMPGAPAPMLVSGSAAPQMLVGMMPVNGTATPNMVPAPMLVNSSGTGMVCMPSVAPQAMMIGSSQDGPLPQAIPPGMVVMMAPVPMQAMPVAAAPAAAAAAAASSAPVMVQQAAPATSSAVAPAAQLASSLLSAADVGRQVFQEALNDNTYNDPQSPEVLALVASGKLPSPGSALHPGKCSPCAWFHKEKGCTNASKCTYCHLCPAGELKARKKAKINMMRMGALEKTEGETGEAPVLLLEKAIDSEQ